MNAIDIGILALMLISVGAGIIRGAIREVMNIMGWVLAYMLAHAFASDLAPLFADWVGEPIARTVLAWAAIFMMVIVVVALIASLVSELVRKLGLSSLDRGVGALIGVARGVLVLLALTLAAGLTRIPQTAVWREATLTPWMEVAALYAKGVLPDTVAAKIRYRSVTSTAPSPATSRSTPPAPTKPLGS
jgi:membrane protein required for colicin V production